MRALYSMPEPQAVGRKQRMVWTALRDAYPEAVSNEVLQARVNTTYDGLRRLIMKVRASLPSEVTIDNEWGNYRITVH